MKKLLNVSLLLTLFAFCMSFAGCKENVEGIGDFALSVKEVGADYIDIKVTAPGTLEMSYLVTEEPMLMTPAVLSRTGETITVQPAQVIRLSEGIFQDHGYYLYAVAKLDDVNFSKVITLEFQTKKYQFDELITIVETYYDGYKVHITVPEETKRRGNVIRTGAMPLAWYNLMKSSKGAADVGMQAIASNGNPYEGHMFTDSTYVMNDANSVLLDENGEPVYDEVTGQMIDIHDPMAPGEPTIIFAGECRYGSPDEFNEVVGYAQPEKYSWSIPCYDRYTQTWHGAFQYKEFFTKEPSLCEATVDVEIPEDEITVTDAMIYFTMDDDVYSYFHMVLDNSTYNQILSTYLDGHEEWFQWFLTSYIAFYEWGVFPLAEDYAVNAAYNFVEPLTGGEKYHVLMTVFGDERGSTQQFVHKTFTAKEKTKVAPAIEVTAVPSNDPYTVSFNVKAAADSKGNVQPIMGAYWACNYSVEFEKMMNAGYTYATLLKNMGWTFSSEELAEINSSKGLTLTFPTLDGEVTRMAVYGCNDEYTFNVIDEENNLAWADNRSPMADKVPSVSSELFAKLEGDWTATATLKARQLLEDGSEIDYNVDHKSKITISASAPALPETLDSYVYDLYSSKFSKDEVDGMYEELRELNDQFTEYRLEGQNRLLCNGFLDFDPSAALNGVNRLEYRSPYDLFVATDYSSVNVSQLMYDFGPKWYLQVLEDGSVIVPFSTTTMPPMHNWPGYPFYVAGVGSGTAFYDANESYPGFPVEISADYNKITIKPIVLSDGKTSQSYYMNALGMSTDGSLELLATVLTDIVLTRGWTEPAQTAAVPACVPASVEAKSINGSSVAALPEVAVMKTMSDFEGKQIREFKSEKANMVTKEMVDETSAKILRKLGIN